MSSVILLASFEISPEPMTRCKNASSFVRSSNLYILPGRSLLQRISQHKARETYAVPTTTTLTSSCVWSIAIRGNRGETDGLTRFRELRRRKKFWLLLHWCSVTSLNVPQFLQLLWLELTRYTKGIVPWGTFSSAAHWYNTFSFGTLDWYSPGIDIYNIRGRIVVEYDTPVF
jgi:hypothetical protein